MGALSSRVTRMLFPRIWFIETPQSWGTDTETPILHSRLSFVSFVLFVLFVAKTIPGPAKRAPYRLQNFSRAQCRVLQVRCDRF